MDVPGADIADPPRPTSRRLTPPEQGLFVRALAGLAIIGASIAQAVASLGGTWLPSFIASNQIASAGRDRLMMGLGVGAALGGGVGFALWFRHRRDDGLARLSWLARFLAPLALVGLLPALLTHDAWPDALTFALTIAAFLLGLEPLLRLHLEARAESPRLHALVARLPRPRWLTPQHPWGARLRQHGAFATVLAGAMGYALYFGFFTVRNHHSFNTFNFDLGQIDSLFYDALHGHPMRCSPLIREGNWSSLRNHAELAIFLLAPIYAIAPRAETLLIMQAVMIGSAALPLFWFSRRRVSQPTAVLLVFAYLLYAPMHGAIFFDFHFQPFAAGVLIWAFEWLDRRAYIRFALFFVLALGCREDISVGLTMLGVFLVVTGQRPKAGVIIAAISAVYFITLRFIIMPAFGTWFFADIYRLLFPHGENNFRGIIRTLLTNPLFTFQTLLTTDKLRYALQILLPIAFLPLRRVYLWLLLLPGFFFTILTTQYSPTTEMNFQYSGHFTAYVFPAAALALAAYGADANGVLRRRAALGAMIVGTLLTTAQWGAFPRREEFRSGYGWVRFDPPSAVDVEKRKDIAELVAMIPPEAILAASDRELPHVSNRITCWGLGGGYEGADYILWVPPANGGRDGVEAAKALASGQWEEIARRSHISLLKRKGAPTAISNTKH